jgi:hypothetical protein
MNAALRVICCCLFTAGLCGSLSPAVAAVLPTTGLQAHYKSDVGVVTGGGGITQWQDQAALNGLNHATSLVGFEPQVSSAPIGYHASFPTVNFAGGDHLNFVLPSANTFTGMTVFVVGNTGAVQSQYETVVSSGGSGTSPGVRWGLGVGNATVQGLGWGGPTSLIDLGNGATGVSPNTWHMLSWQKTATTWNVRREVPSAALLNTVADNSFFTGNWNGVIGTENSSGPTNYFFSGNLAEILIYDQALSAGQYQQVVDYLNERFFVAPPVPAPEPATGWMVAAAALISLQRRRRSSTASSNP